MEQKEPVITYDHLADEYSKNASANKQNHPNKQHLRSERVLFILEEALIIALMMTMLFML